MTDFFEGREPKKCWRHLWMAVDNQTRTECTSCGKVKDPAVSRRSRNNKNRGLGEGRQR